MSRKGSAWAQNVALGVQYAFQPSHPSPASQATKKARAVSVIDRITGSTVGIGFNKALPLGARQAGGDPGGLVHPRSPPGASAAEAGAGGCATGEREGPSNSR